MNLRLLIAEDEKVERQALRLLISRSFPEIQILEDAVNGIDLIRKVEKDDPNIIITDIEMPGLSGLEAIETLKQKGFQGKLIVQTAYSQFEYARQALALDAEAYLLKPIKKEKLISKLKVVIQNIRDENDANDEKIRYREILSQMRPLLDQEVISSIQLNDIHPSFLMPYLKQILPMESFTILTISRSIPDWDPTSQDAMNRDQFVKDMRKILELSIPVILGSPVNKRQTALIGHSVDDSYKTRIEAINTAEYLQKELNNRENNQNEVHIGIGRSVKTIQEIPRSYKESLIALKSGSENTGIMHFGDLDPNDTPAGPLLIPIEKLLEIILRGDDDKTKNFIDEFTANEMIPHLNLPELKDLLLNSLIEINREISTLITGRTHQVDTLKRYLNEMSNCRNHQQIIQWYTKEIEILASANREQNRNRIHSSVLKAQNFIEKNYMRDISLDLVAEEIGVSPYHLSHLFKQELKINYIKYLTSIRMRYAKDLIENGDYSLDELARLCGYNNSAYFARVFNKQTGQIVKEEHGYCRMV